ncbi:MAG: SPOR domain-containing protein [Candidatus Latescibacterota bacterium]|nr:MAG: SPOR domain-containing protein [Candidatus Latescibacterota bacterium]
MLLAPARDDSGSTRVPRGGADAAAAAAGAAVLTQPSAPVPGYRIQLAACESREVAEALRAEASARVDSSVYVEHDGPLYKVRVGDCATQEECLGLRDQLRQAGYSSAWIVRTRIQAP